MQRSRKPVASDDTVMPRTTKALILCMVRPYKTKIILFFSLTFIGVLAWAAAPLMIARVVTELGRTHSVDQYVAVLIAAYIVLRFMEEVLWRVAELIMRSYKPQMIESVRFNLFSAVLKKSHSFFVDSSSGRIGHWINQTVETTNELVDITIWNVWGRLIGLIISAVFLFLVHWSIAMIFIIWLTLLFTFNVYRGKRFSQLVALQSDEASKAAGLVVDSVSNHVSVRVFGAQEGERRMLATQQAHIIQRWRDSWGQNLVTNVVKGQSAAFISAVALCLVVALFGYGVVPLGSIVLFVAYFGDASTSLWELAWALDSYYRNFGTIQNALDGLQAEDERQVLASKRAIHHNAPLTLRLVDLSFAYPERPDLPVLDALNLQIESGEKVGIVGHSGAGKSTLVGLLLGLYEPTSGTILLNGESTTDHGPSFIRSFSSFVPQDTNLFNRTVRENVTYARPSASDDDITAALQQAQAYDFVTKLPHGLDTIIGERGVKLSGGQRQRIAIARAILQRSPLLILDEATSALDSISEQAIQKALYGLMRDRTSIVIAHRLSTLRNLDRIIVLDGGKIVEEGPHESLITRGGIYADLWKRQKDGFVVD